MKKGFNTLSTVWRFVPRFTPLNTGSSNMVADRVTYTMPTLALTFLSISSIGTL